jgi:hypothetical protein
MKNEYAEIENAQKNEETAQQLSAAERFLSIVLVCSLTPDDHSSVVELS